MIFCPMSGVLGPGQKSSEGGFRRAYRVLRTIINSRGRRAGHDAQVVDLADRLTTIAENNLDRRGTRTARPLATLRELNPA
jgi:hypothetical protein